MTTVPIKDCGLGVNKDALPAELELGMWSDTLNFRFRAGFAEKWGGFRTLGTATSALPPSWMHLYGTSANRFCVYGALTAAYALHQTFVTTTQITPYPDAKSITTLTRDSGTVARVTTTALHGLGTGNTVSVFGATETGYNVTDASITVISTTVFTYPVTSIAANATVVGAYVVTSADTGTDFSSGNKTTGGVLNGFLLVNTVAGGLYYWNGDTAKKLRRFAFTTYIADVARPFKGYIVQLAKTVAGTKKPYNVSWSNAAEPGATPTTFAAAATNDAGEVDLAQTDGKMVDCLPLNDVNVIYTQDARYAMQYIGSEAVFSFTRLPGTDGLLAANCVVNTPKGHVFMTPAIDIKIHQGGEATSLLDGRFRRYLQSNISAINDFKQYSFLAADPQASEVYVFFPSLSASEVDKCIAWNWVDDKWSIYDISSDPITAATTGLFPMSSAGTFDVSQAMVVANTTAKKIGTPTQSLGTYFGSSITGTLERVGMHLEQRDSFKTLQRSRWNIDGTAAQTATVYHGSSKTADATPTYTSGGTYTIGTTDYVNQRATSGRFCALKLTTTAWPFFVRSIDLDVTAGGTR